MSDYELMIKISGSTQAIKAIEDWLSNDLAYQALVNTIANIVDQTIAESGVLGKKKATVTVSDKTMGRSIRQFANRLETQQKADNVIKGVGNHDK